MTRSSILPILLLTAITGCADISELDELTNNTDKIVDGTEYNGHPSVVRVRSTSGSCTGTVIHPKVVITAKHCIEDKSVEEIYIADDHRRSLARAVKIFTTEGSYWGQHHKDFASLVLDRELTITPAQWVESIPDVTVGTQVLAVGFGMTDVFRFDGASDEKRRGDAQLTGIYDQAFATTPIGCYGDSGGPIFLPDGRVWGVLAYFELTGDPNEKGPGNQANCRVVNSLYARTDIHSGLVRNAISLAEGQDISGNVGQPKDFKASASGRKVILSWKAPNTDFQSFELEHEKKKNGEWSGVSSKQVSGSKRRLKFKTSSGSHRYRIRAVGQSGVSEWSPWEKVKI